MKWRRPGRPGGRVPLTGGPTFGPDFLTELFRDPLDPGYADAAARRAAEGPRTGWRHATTRGVALVTLLALGFLLAVAYRQTMAEEPARTQARASLIEQVQRREAETDELRERAERLRTEVAELRDAALGGSAAARLRDLEAVTGMAPVRGDGVVVRLADGRAPADATNSSWRVLDRDLQDLTNALWAAGAEAVAVNGHRLTATSTIRAAGGAILVDFRPVTSPYDVSAIGPAEMAERFEATAAARLFRRLVEEYGMTFSVRGADDLTLPAASRPQLRHATEPSPSPVPTAGTGGTPSVPVPGGPVPSSSSAVEGGP